MLELQRTLRVLREKRQHYQVRAQNVRVYGAAGIGRVLIRYGTLR